MWIGVTLAVLLSIAVGVGLKLVEEALPQAAQEGLETIIGIIAVCFVTGMIVWMNKHARDMKRQLETEAAHALGRASTYALASMAFLAVLKEGFETSVFLLATFSAAQSAGLAAAGAVIGILIAVVIGWGIYAGGVRFNLSKFFRYTAAFLILVAAGLVISSLRTAHEAGWLNAGQQIVMNLGWLVAPGTVQSALITGVLGIPADPRLIEVFGWLAYLIPVALYLYWPKARRPSIRGAAHLKIMLAIAAIIAALGLVVGYPTTQPAVPNQAELVTATNHHIQSVGTIQLDQIAASPASLTITLKNGASRTLRLSNDNKQQQQRDGIQTSAWKFSRTYTPARVPTTVTLQQVVTLAGGRLPIGLNPRQQSGPFDASWSTHGITHAWLAKGQLVDATGRSITTITLSHGGLLTPRTFVVRANAIAGISGNWRVNSAHVAHAVDELNHAEVAQMERQFWALELPLFLSALALVLLILGWRALAQLSKPSASDAASSDPEARPHADQSHSKGASNVA